MTPTIKYTRPPIDSRILEAILDRLYNIVAISTEMVNENCQEERHQCLSKIDDTIVSLCAALTMIESDVQRMDKQIIELLAYAGQKTTQSLN